MQTIKIEDISISPERQRKVFNPESIGRLSESIGSKGLFHAIILEHGTNKLGAGECRLKAIALLRTMGGVLTYNGEAVPEGEIPYTRLKDMSADLIYEAELEENIRRTNLSPQEEMTAIAELHKLRVKQNPSHTKGATGMEINPNVQPESAAHDVTEALAVNEYLNHPTVAKAKTKKEAVKAVTKIKQREHAQKVAEAFQREAPEKHAHVPVNDEAIATLRKMPTSCVDVICTDPPYGINAQDFGDMADNEHSYDDSYETWKILMEKFSVESYRVAKAKAHAYVFCSWERFYELEYFMAAAGWDVWQRPLIWAKNNGMLAKPKFGPRYTYETILFANKGEREVQKIGAPDVLQIMPVAKPKHAAEKPLALYEELLSRSVCVGDHVLDCFMGNGVIFPAANKLNCIATGIELNKTAYGFAVQRLEEEKK